MNNFYVDADDDVHEGRKPKVFMFVILVDEHFACAIVTQWDYCLSLRVHEAADINHLPVVLYIPSMLSPS